MFFAIPPRLLLEKDEKQLIDEIRQLISWLKRHTKKR